jgi:hypothetical protein
VVAAVRRIVAPDHLPLQLGSGWSTNAISGTGKVRMLVCCAPNRSLRRKEVNPDQAVALFRAQFAGLFPVEPVFSMPEHGVRFAPDGGTDGGYGWVHASGRVDLSMNIPTEVHDAGSITISVLDVVDPVLRVVAAMRSAAYRGTFGARVLGLRRRFDWAIAVSPTVVVPEWGSASWTALMFPGAIPPRAGTQQQASCPPLGYAAAALRNWDVRRPDTDVLRVFLRDFLYQNGYHNVDAAVEDSLRAVALAAAAGEGSSRRT